MSSSSDEYNDEDMDIEESTPSEEFVDQYNDFRKHWPFGGKGKPVDVPAPSGAACLQINKLLARAEKSGGEFTFGRQADSLPVLPGLFVEGVGQILVPLTEETANTLIAVCEKAPFGRKHETLLDDNVRNSWQLGASQVELKNPLWQNGMEKLSSTIAERLGYKDVPLQCKLYKLLVYAEGGHFAKHKDTEKEDGMIATLVIQPPSMHKGGDLVVYRDSTTQYRHDFGEADGTAAYVPHYAVHYADAEHSLEEVTKGYRLALVYSVCLPPTIRHLRRDYDKPLSEDLAGAIGSMSDDDDSFALLLSHQYTAKSIEDLGTGALKGVDRARFLALEAAIAGVPLDKKLYFFIAQLSHEVYFFGAEKFRQSERIAWYSTCGQSFGEVEKSELKPNFLNPSLETLSRLWRPYGSSTHEGYLGNETATRNTTYSRYAIVAWQKMSCVDKAFKFINGDADCSSSMSKTC